MSLAMLKQDAEILLEVAENYELILSKKDEAEKREIYLRNFRSQFLYLLAAMHKLIEKEKNAR